MSNKQLYEKENNINKPFFPVVRLEDIIDTISEKSIQWILNNYNHIYVEWKNDVVGTRLSVPTILRRNGLWITYNNGDRLIIEYYIGKNTEIKDKHWQDDTNWEDYTNKLIDGTVEYRHLSESLKQLLNKENITNFPDEEDLTSDGVTLSFKDREYQPENFSGLGRIILRKNIVKIGEEYKNILTQSMINKKNTIYEIRYDFNLNGQEIIIPEGCVLDFQGGSLSNGTLVGNQTFISAPNKKIFQNIKLEKDFCNSDIILEWWNNSSENKTDDSIFINRVIQAMPNNKTLVFTNNEYHIDDTIILDKTININCSGVIYSNNCSPAILLYGIKFSSINIKDIRNNNAIFEFSESSNWRYNSAIVLYNCWHCNIEINNIYKFNSAIILVAEGNSLNNGGCTYNDITLGVLDSCFNGIRIMGINNGWCNGNVIHRAKFLYHSWNMLNKIPYFIYIDSYGTPLYKNNSLYFNNLMIEFGVKQDEYPKMIYANNLNGGYFHFTRVEVLRGDETTADYNGVIFGDNVHGSKIEVDFSWQLIKFNNRNSNDNRLYQTATYGVISAREVDNILNNITYANGVTPVFEEGFYNPHTGLVVYNATLRLSSTTRELLRGLPSSRKELFVCIDNLNYNIWDTAPISRISCHFKEGTLKAQTDVQYNTAVVISLVYHA